MTLDFDWSSRVATISLVRLFIAVNIAITLVYIKWICFNLFKSMYALKSAVSCFIIFALPCLALGHFNYSIVTSYKTYTLFFFSFYFLRNLRIHASSCDTNNLTLPSVFQTQEPHSHLF